MARGKSRSSNQSSSDTDTAVTRRDFLGSTLLASGATLLSGANPLELLAAQEPSHAAQSNAAAPNATDKDDDFTGYGGVGDYRRSNGNTLSVLEAGHAIRDGAYDPLPTNIIDLHETYDCVIVGGGISGLAAALFFQRQGGPRTKCLVLENHPIFGGEAKQNEFLVDGHRLIAHQGSAIYQIQYPHSFLANFYDSIGLKTPTLTYQKWSGPDRELPLSKTPYEAAGLPSGHYGFWFGTKFGNKPGMWITDPIGKNLEGAPIPQTTRAEWLRFLKGEAVEARKFEHPRVEGDAISRYLDSITLEQHFIERFGLSRETVRTFLSPVEGGGSGLGPDALSAYSDYAFEMLHPLPEDKGGSDQMFPGGNATIARLMLKTVIPAAISGPHSVEGVCRNSVNFAALDSSANPARIRLSSTVINVAHDGDPARANSLTVVYQKDGRLYRVHARSAVMAGGCWTTKHIIKDLPEAHRNAYAQFYRSPCMMANVAVKNWRFLYKMGITGCHWFEGIGNYMDVRKLALTGLESPTISPDAPTVLTLKVLYAYPGEPTEAQGKRGRTEMLTTSFRDYETQIRAQFDQMFSHAGFDAKRDIAGIILNRWGHAYLNPQPGFFFGKDGQPAPRQVLREAPFGRIAFANTDLAGAMDHRYSILEAKRAVEQLFDQVLTA
jgi:spermidine dehydrogenase